MSEPQLSEATQEYLESIYWLYESGIERTQANLARALQVSQPSASEMLKRMSDARSPSGSSPVTGWSRPTWSR
jgi:Mn-dependent DtxR family transcriptional regulator